MLMRCLPEVVLDKSKISFLGISKESVESATGGGLAADLGRLGGLSGLSGSRPTGLLPLTGLLQFLVRDKA